MGTPEFESVQWGPKKLDVRYNINDTEQALYRSGAGQDLLSHSDREDRIHILSLDPILATDVYERIYNDPRMKNYRLYRPRKTEIRDAVEEIEDMARDTVLSRLLIIDVRKETLPKLRTAYNKIVGYNRRDLNKLCFIILIGDGPVNLFWEGKTLDVFVPYLSAHRVDFHPAAFFYDPFLHYERGEIERGAIDDKFVLPDKIPARFVPYFIEDENMDVDRIRRYFRAIGKSDEIRKKRLRRLRSLYRKRIAEQFPLPKNQLKALLSKKGIRLASEKMHLYPLYFEDWVYELMQKAKRRSL
jgi:hypothetical protein